MLSMKFDFGTIDAAMLKKLIAERDGMLKYRVSGHFVVSADSRLFFDDEYFNIFEFIEDFRRFGFSSDGYSFTMVDFDGPILEFEKSGNGFALKSVWADSDAETTGDGIMCAYDNLCSDADRYLAENFGRSLEYVMKLCGQKN